VPKSQYIAVCRATGQVSRASVILAVQSVVQLIAVCIGGKLDGLIGVCLGLLIVGFLECLVTAPTVFRAAAGRLRLGAVAVEGGQAAGPARDLVPDTVPQPVITPDFDYRQRQSSGLAALVAIATSMAPQNRAYEVITGSFPAIRETGAFPAVSAAVRPGMARPGPGEHGTVRPGTSEHDTPRPGTGRGRHRRTGSFARRTGSFARLTGSFRAVSDLTATGMQAPLSEDAEYRLRQEAGLAALMAIATRPARF
jgi:hypothetical protein